MPKWWVWESEFFLKQAPSEVFARRKSIGDTSLHILMHGGAR